LLVPASSKVGELDKHLKRLEVGLISKGLRASRVYALFGSARSEYKGLKNRRA